MALKPELSSSLSSSNATWAGIRKRKCGPEQIDSTVTRCDKEQPYDRLFCEVMCPIGCSNCSYISQVCSICSGCYLCLSASASMWRSFDTVIWSSLGRGAREGPKQNHQKLRNHSSLSPQSTSDLSPWRKDGKEKGKCAEDYGSLTNACMCEPHRHQSKKSRPCRVSPLFLWHRQRHLPQTSRAERPDNQACLTDSDGRLDRSNLSTQIELLHVYLYIWSDLHLSAILL